MNEFTAIDAIKLWISAHGFPGYEIEGEPVWGTYGLVFLLNAAFSGASPQSIAVKTFDPNQLPEKPSTLQELQREFAMWLRLPDHANVLRAGRLKTAILQVPDPSAPRATRKIEMPLMQMERMDGCISSWVGNNDYSRADKLLALAQAFNGLAHLYANGIQGHGDLKPSNLLFTDIRKKYRFASDTWLHDHPWIIKVADLGWADAWVDYYGVEYKKKALREYLAPERTGNEPRVLPERSDMFSMGVIAAELICGKHPSANLKKAKKSDGEWLRRAERREWMLDGICSERLKDLIDRCLDPDPAKRPSANEAMQTICQELQEAHGLDVAPDLELWTKEANKPYAPYISTNSEEIERLGRTFGLGAEQESKSLERLRQIFEAMAPDNIYSLEDWVYAASTILDFRQRMDGQLDSEETVRVRQRAREHLEKTLGHVDHRDLAAMAASIDTEDRATPFERFSDLVGNLAVIAKVDFEQAYQGEWDLSDLALAGFAFAMASRSRSNPATPRGTFEYLDIAIDRSLIEATPYFFRASWRDAQRALQECGIEPEDDFTAKDVIKDLEIACKLAPQWSEPQTLLEQVQRR